MASLKTKSELRKQLIAMRQSMDESYCRDASENITLRCIDIISSVAPIQTLHTYLPITTHREIDTWPIVKWFSTYFPASDIFVPVIREGGIRSAKLSDNEQLIIAKYEITEPARPTIADKSLQFSAIIVPVLGFDDEGYRLGFGKGYYDKFLAGQPGITIGVAYSKSEIKPALPREKHDVTLDFIVTEKEIFRFI